MEDFVTKFATVGSGNKKRGRKKKGTTAEDEPTLSEVISARMHSNSRLKFIGTRAKGTALVKEFKSIFTKDQVRLQEKIAKLEKANRDQVVHVNGLEQGITELETLPEDYMYLGGILVRIKGKEIRYLIPRGVDGEKFYKWKLNYWPRIIKLCTEAN